MTSLFNSTKVVFFLSRFCWYMFEQVEMLGCLKSITIRRYSIYFCFCKRFVYSWGVGLPSYDSDNVFRDNYEPISLRLCWCLGLYFLSEYLTTCLVYKTREAVLKKTLFYNVKLKVKVHFRSICYLDALKKYAYFDVFTNVHKHMLKVG